MGTMGKSYGGITENGISKVHWAMNEAFVGLFASILPSAGSKMQV